ncbi:MAG TPA: hypothetical protein VGK58_03510 [Lacipirellulaceae bacterium]
MAYYQLFTYDERDNNYITLRDNLDGGPLIYCAYLDCSCQSCHSIDRDALFARKSGLEGGPEIRVSKGRELAEARDGFLLIKSRVLDLLKRHDVAGYDTRQIPYTDWYVFRVTTRVPYREFKPERKKAPCATCGRGAYYGNPFRVGDIAVPDHPNTFFAPDVERTNCYDVYLTESVAQTLKSEGVKGGLLMRLLEDDEARLVQKGTPAAQRMVKNRRVYLT